MVILLLRLFGARLLTDAQILEVARQRCVAEGWPWTEPVSLGYALVRLEVLVTTNARNRGGNARVSVDVRRGEVVGGGFVRY